MEQRGAGQIASRRVVQTRCVDSALTNWNFLCDPLCLRASAVKQ